VDAPELRRGQTLLPPGMFVSTSAIDCEFQLLAGAHPLKHRAPIHFHAGTAEVEAEVRLLAANEAIEPGSTRFLRLLLKEPLLLLPGDRFIARMFSPVVTIGGGIVIDNHAPTGMRKPAALARLAPLRDATPEQRAHLLAAEHPDGLPLAELILRCGRPIALPPGLKLVQGRVISAGRLAELAQQLRECLARFHQASPLQPGMARAAAPIPVHLLDAVLAEAPDLVAEGEILRLRAHRLQLKSEEDAALQRMEGLFRLAALAVPAVNDVIAQSGIDPARARQLLQILQRNQRLIRVSPELLYHTEAIEDLRQLLQARRGLRFSVPEFKDWTGVSRKYAIPLLEWLDRERVTRREGDKRLVL
jgi:selenocysteine-specific elongation factor